MGVVEWGALAALVGFLLTFAGALFKVSDRLNKAESTASNANISALAADIRIHQLERDLASHKEYVAREYVSRDVLSALETRLIDAINRLGDRLDSALGAGRSQRNG